MGGRAYAATAATLNFQARISGTSGQVVPDGFYNVQFKIYDGGTQGGPAGAGLTNSGTGGVALWTESRYDTNGPTAGNDFRVRVVNGYFSVNLGDTTTGGTAFPGTINWDQELWLTMNVGGSAQTASPTYDGEMTNANVRTRLTAVPYAFRAGKLQSTTNGALTGDGFAQLGQTNVQTINTTTPGLQITQSGTGGLLSLSGPSGSVFTLSNAGDIFTKGTLDVDGASIDVGTSTLRGSLIIQDGAGKKGTLTFGAGLTADRTYNLPDVGGTICLTSTCASAATAFVQDGNSFSGLATLGTNDSNDLVFETAGTEKVRIDTSGNVGIGGAPSSPNKLTITGNGLGNQGLLLQNNQASGSAYVRTQYSANAQSFSTGVGNSTETTFGVANKFYVFDATANAIRMVIDSSGRIGIGSTSPAASSLLSIGASNQFQVNASGDLTSVFTALDGNNTTNGTSGGTTSTSLILTDATLFDVGNYVQVSDTNCGGTGVNVCYAKITGKASNTLTVAPALRWTTGKAVVEYHVPELGGTNLTQTLANRYGRGYFISGVATGNGTTFYNEDSVDSSLSSFNFLNTTVATLNIGAATTALNLGGASSIVRATGSFSSPTFTNTAGLSLTTSVGASNDITIDSGSNKLVIAATDTTLQRTATGSYTIDLNDTGATTLILNNSGTGAASLNLNDGGLAVASSTVLTNAAGLQNLTGYGQTSGNFGITGTGNFSTGTGTVGLNGATTISTATNSATALTINGTTGTAATALNVAQTGNAANLTLTNTARTTGALVSLTQSTSAFTGTGLLLNFASGSGSFASGKFLDFQVNGTTKLQIDNAGALMMSTDSTGALLVQASGGLDLFNVDTVNNIVRVGNGIAGADGTGIIFVLDSKNTNGDPTGEEGAQYYNSKRGTFRCYQNNRGWTDCLGVAKPNTRRTTNIAYPGSGTTMNADADVAATTGTAVAATTTEPALFNIATTAGINANNSQTGNLNYNSSNNLGYQTYIQLPAITNTRVWAGLTDQTGATMAGNANPAGNYAAFRFDTGAGDATWKCITKNNATQTIVDSGITVATTGLKMEIVMSGTSAEFKINGDTVCTSTTTLPTAGTMMRYANTITNTALAVRNLRIGWIFIETDK